MEGGTMKNVVITGSTRGIGFGMASAFLERGCSVAISGREQESVQRALEQLREEETAGTAHGYACDVCDATQVQSLWWNSREDMGHIDIWINNAGVNGSPKAAWENSPQEAEQVVRTNILGVVHGSQVALNGMLDQGFGAIYNMEGMGSDGGIRAGMVLYGMTKRAVSYFTRGLIKEAKSTPLVIGTLRPGMVITDLITDAYRGQPEEWDRVKGIFNVIADRVETVAPWLVDRILENSKTGARIRRSSRLRLMLRFITAPFIKRDVTGDVEIRD
jgi:NAD(P)-dependent dehydrogenase (short-subunit alcohol dehydrogenase family)